MNRFQNIIFHSLIVVLGVLCVSTVQAQDSYFKLESYNTLKMKNIKRQSLDYSCGASALSILLSNYFQDDLDEHELLSDIVFRLSNEEKKDRISNGFSMLDLKNLAERLGYFADGVILPQEAVSLLDGPVIILLKKNSLNHFVVLKGVSQGHAFIADPANGHLRMPLYELFDQWHGEALIIGKTGFGLPQKHGLSIPSGDSVAPERDIVRVLQNTPLP